MPTAILATKLYAPPRRPERVLRPCLIRKLNEGLRRRLTLISAPAGFGKTTLASDWIAGCGRPSAWLSLDERDGDMARFLTYLVAALQTIKADIGAGAMAALQSPMQPPTESVLTSLVNEIDAMPDDFVLVLDDYQAIEAGQVDDALAFILEHMPPRMHLVIATREDPNLPLAAWRARGQLTELRATDLRFSPAEAAEFFNGAMGLELSGDTVAALERRTEGWIAGMQMAALSLRGRSDTADFMQAFSGSHRFVLDYLVEEVLQRQAESARDFLLETAILDGLCGPLCDAVTGRTDGAQTLEALERGNLFIVPLDDRRQWYRYHHLFADVLRVRLTGTRPDRISTLHRRASEWYERNGSPTDAIFHALAARDFGRAAGLIELAGPAMEENSLSSTWLGWVRELPEGLVRARPALCVWHALALLAAGDGMEAAESRLRDAEHWLAKPGAGMLFEDESQFRSLPATIAVARAYLAQSSGDVPGTVKHAELALDLLPEENRLRRQQVAGLLGISYWAKGDLEAAGRVFAEYNARLRTARNIPDAIGTAFVLADIRVSQGQLGEAARALEQTLRFVEDRGGPMPADAADLYRGLSELSLERGDIESAARFLSKGEELGGQGELVGWQHRLRLAQARMKHNQGDLDGALDLLYEAERLYVMTPLPVLRPIPAMKARIWLAQGKLAEAMGWVRERNVSDDDELGYLHEYEHLTLARVLIARHIHDRDEPIHGAMGLLERLLHAAESGGRIGSAIEILALRSLAFEAVGDLPHALESLDRALSLAEPEGYVRIFVDEGPRMADLLTRLPPSRARGTRGMEAYILRLLAAFGKPSPSRTMKSLHSPKPGIGPEALPRRPLSRDLYEPLSRRELEVLDLIGHGLSNKEIGERLFLALDTIKGHNRRIFDKLDVKRRTEALARARELGLL